MRRHRLRFICTSAATVDLGKVHLATSTLKWEMREGRATFERADMVLNRTVRLASWGTCEFTGNGRRVDATLLSQSSWHL